MKGSTGETREAAEMFRQTTKSGLIPGDRGSIVRGPGKKKYKSKGKIEAGDGGGAYVLFPYDTEKEFATKGKVPVKATFDGVPHRGSLVKYGNPLHTLGMLRAIREQIGKGPGDAIEVVVWKDELTPGARARRHPPAIRCFCYFS